MKRKKENYLIRRDINEDVHLDKQDEFFFSFSNGNETKLEI